MALFKTKQKQVEARQHVGPQSINVIGRKGEQRANPGDFILIHKPEDGSPAKPSDREVMPAKDFFDTYEFDKDATEAAKQDALAKSSGDGRDPGAWTEAGDGTDYPGSPDYTGSRSVYGTPHHDSIEEAQAAAADHYAPESHENEYGDVVASPKSSKPYEFTVGSDPRVYNIQPNGTVNQVAVSPADTTVDPGTPTPNGAALERLPQTLAVAGETVHDTPGPISPYQANTAAAESPAQTFGNTLDGSIEPTGADAQPDETQRSE